MELRMNFSSFIKLKEATRIDNINGEISKYNLIKDELSGVLNVNGQYYKGTNNLLTNFSEEIPFTVMFASENYEVTDVDCINLEYDFIDGRGIEVNFDIIIMYEEYNNDDFTEVIEDTTTIDQLNNTFESQEEPISEMEIPELEITDIDTTDIKEIKDKITDVFDNRLTTSLNGRDDNLPSEEVITPKNEERSVIKVFYYHDEIELEQLCKKTNLPIQETLNKDHQNKRVIINE